jgi:hypothetical protein
MTPITDPSTGLVDIGWQGLFDRFDRSSSLTSGIEVIVAAEVGMAVNGIRIIQPVQLTTTLENLYTVPTKTRIQITRATVSNPTVYDRLISVYLVPSGEAPNNSNIVVVTRNIGAGQTVNFDELRHSLSVGDSIHAQCDLDAALSFSVSAAVFF